MSKGVFGRGVAVVAVSAVSLLSLVPLTGAPGTGWTVVAWNNLGMHCMDADFAVFSILPPYNTIQAHVIDQNGKLIAGGSSVKVTYEAVADATSSINTTSKGKTNFWTWLAGLLGVSLPVDAGLKGANMPGQANVPQPMTFDPALNWFIAEGIPITPTDDTGKKNPYPMMRVRARDLSGNLLASTDIVLPVSDEMDCSACHASTSGPAARPATGWVHDADPQRDYRLNILKLHDDRNVGKSTYTAALLAVGYNTAGLSQTVQVDKKPVLCALCHRSEALATTGQPGVPSLTAAVHGRHATVIDPKNGLALDSTANRSACYRCHPGSETRCLRGAMGSAVASDGSLSMQCQGCHGSMAAVGGNRTGWLDEPSCGNCHTGTATLNSGQIRYTSALDGTGARRTPASSLFTTNAGTPAAGFSLYRFSKGHGGLQCSACHGSTHAEYPASHPNDNVQSLALQGHVGTIAECTTCHNTSPATVSGGPHGMHPVGSQWVSDHHDYAGNSTSRAACQACHGVDYRGTVLSRAFGPRSLSTRYGTKTLWRGYTVGCYTCHNGPTSDNSNPNRAPAVSNLTATTNAGASVAVPLSASDADGNALTLRIVSQPSHGTVGLAGTTATYKPDTGFSGTDLFSYAAWDGMSDSNLGTVTVTVRPAAPTGSPTAYFTLEPCRALDTRSTTGAEAAAPALASLGVRTFLLAGRCGIPVTAKAISTNITAVNAANTGSIVAYPGDESTPNASLLSFPVTNPKANNALIRLSPSGTASVFNDSAGSVHFVLDVTGWFE